MSTPRLVKPDMVDAIVAHAEARRSKGPRCYTCQLSPDVLEAIHQAKDRSVEISAIYDYLVTKLNLKVSQSGLGKHFRERHADRG